METKYRKLAPVVAAGLVVLAAVVALRLEGRSWWCACGGWQPWIGDAWGNHTSQHLFDPYSFAHIQHGLVFWWILAVVARGMPTPWRMVTGLTLESFWELLENSHWVIDRYRGATAALGYTGDTVLNSAGDLVACGFGLWLARRLGWRWSVAWFVATEIVLVVTIRDSLMINVIMLLSPIEGIKRWQLGG